MYFILTLFIYQLLNNSPTRPSDLVLSEKGAKLQKKLWNETVEVLKKQVPSTDGSGDIYNV